MGKPPWDDLEAQVQKFCDASRDSIKFAIRASAINLDDPMLDHLGRKFLEDGIRDGNLKKIMKGTSLLSVSAAYSEIAKNAFGRERTKPGRDKKKIKDDARIPDLDAAVGEAAYLDKTLAGSEEFGLSRMGIGWPSLGTIKQAISRRIKPILAASKRIKGVKTNRVNPT
jgi:hypothetical protein